MEEQIKVLKVQAFWDEEAQVWWASSDDVPGLATEAPTREELVRKLQIIIPELLDANGVADEDNDEIPFELVSSLTAVAHRRSLAC